MTSTKLAFVVLAWAGTLRGQSSQISGVILDPSHSNVSGAHISLLNEQTGGRRNAQSNGLGYYSFPSLGPGIYRIVARAAGFETAVVEGIKLEVGENTQFDFNMRVGDFRTVLTVKADTQTMNTENASVGTVIDRNIIDQMPLNGRGIQSLIELSPGMVALPVANTGEGQFATNGQRDNANYFTVDGASVNFAQTNSTLSPGSFSGSQLGAGMIPANNFFGNFSNLISADALQEFRIQTSTFAPEFGRSPGAQVELVSRSGTNRYSGSAFEFIRNDKTDAADWFLNRQASPKLPLRFNDFGGTLGGPFLIPRLYNGRDRTFFFVSLEKLVLIQHGPGVTFTVPDLQSRLIAPPPVAALLNAYPRPNRPNGNLSAPGFSEYLASGVLRQDQPAFGIRLDHTLSNRLLSFARYNRAPSQRIAPLGSAPQTADLQIATETLTAGLTHAPTSNLVNEVRFNVSSQFAEGETRVNAGQGAQMPPDSIFFPPGFTFKDSFALAGIAPAPLLAFGRIVSTRTRQLQGVDNFSYSLGAHQLKFGADYRWYSPEATIYRLLNYSPLAETSLSDGLIFASTFTFVSSPTTAFVVPAFSAYAQDTWRIARRLTATYGLRWEVAPGPRVSAGQASSGSGFPNSGGVVTLLPAGTPAYPTSWTNVAPRLGLAWQVMGGATKKTVLRVGAGRFFDLGQSGVEGRAFAATTSLVYLNQPFGSPSGGTLILKSEPTTPATVAGPLRVVPPDYTLPYTWGWNATIEQALGAQTFSAGYIGALGRRLASWTTEPRQDSVSALFFSGNESSSAYHALQLQFNRRMSTRLHMLTSYTWSHSIDDLSSDHVYSFPGGGPTSGSFQPRKKGASAFDIRHNLTGSIIASLPSPQTGIAARLFHNWTANTIFFARTATPTDLLADNYVHRPDLVPNEPLYLYGSQFPGGKSFNRAAFSFPPPGRDGNLGRNVLRGLGSWQIDLGLHREFPLAETVRLQFRAEAFNILNHPNFANPSNFQTPGILTLSSQPGFGAARQTLATGLNPAGVFGGLTPLFQIGGPRTLQFALRLRY